MSNPSSPDTNYSSLLKDALVAMRQLQAELATIKEQQTEAIAIIGMACRFPGANNPEAFWQLLRNGINTVSEIPDQRWDISAYYDANLDIPGKMYTKQGYFIDKVDEFDARFFGISPREAAAIDPQQRLLLEVSYEALERAGQSPQQVKGSRTGVFIGLCFDDYAKYSISSGDTQKIDAFSSLGNTRSIAAGRIAYVLGLQGPVMQLDTTCSSSLVGLHLACQSLRNGESDMALVGGVNLMLSPEVTIGFCKLKALAADGKCKTFDAAADGYGRGEGCGIVVVKRLSDALANRDNIIAVVRGSAMNHDGASNGLTAPNGAAQEAVIREALKNARLEPHQIQYIEAHGTGTVLGDPIEVLALAKVLGEGRSKNEPLHIGSVKTNIGHLEGAAGVAGLIKVVLSLQHQQIPPHLNFEQPNPYIPWDKLPVVVPTQLTPWQSQNQQLLAGVSSFGMSGTNVHVILENAKNFTKERNEGLNVLTLSAKTPQALKELVQSYADFCASPPDINFADVCFTSNVGRSHFQYRLALVANSYINASKSFIQILNRDTIESFPSQECSNLIFASFSNVRENLGKIAFLFTGQGSQYINMGKELYSTQVDFRYQIDYCCELLYPHLNLDLRLVLFDEEKQADLNQTIYTQPALFILEYALCQLWLSWGVTPDYLMGHSVGEYVAACVTGVFSLEDAIKLIANRACLMQQLPQNGKMVVVAAPASDIAEQLQNSQISIAAINTPNNTVISGEQTAINEAVAIFQARGIKTTPLGVSHAFHSSLMEPILREFAEVARSISYQPPQIPIISNLTGKVIDAEIATAEYWCHHILQPVLFAAGMQTLVEENCKVFLEIGAKPTLLSMGQTCFPEAENLVWLPSLRLGQPDLQVMLSSLASLYMQGVDINWQNFYGDEPYQHVVIPTYPFQRQRFWVETTRKLQDYPNYQHPLLGQKLQLAKLEKIYFESKISQDIPKFLQHHQVFGNVVMPAAGYVEMVLSAAREIWGKDKCIIQDMTISQALFIPENTDVTLQVILTPLESEVYQFEVVSKDDSWVVHGSGVLRELFSHAKAQRRKGRDNCNIDGNLGSLAELQIACPEEVSVSVYYQICQEVGVNYGDDFQRIQRLWKGEKEALGEVHLSPELITDISSYQIHPTLLDACFQVMGAIFLNQEASTAYLPVGIEQICWYDKVGENLWSFVKIRDENGLIGDIQLFHPDGRLIGVISGLQIQPVGQTKSNLWEDWLYQVEWQEQPLVKYNLSSPQAIATLPFPQSTQLNLDYTSLISQLEDLSIACVFQAFEQLQLPLQPGEEFSTTEAMLAMGIVKQQQRLCLLLLQILQSAGILQEKADIWQVLRRIDKNEINSTFRDLHQTYPNATAELNLLERCTNHLANILQGSEAIALLFPNGDFSDLTQLYQNSPLAQVMNNLVQQAVIAAIQKIPSNSALRILEIGAGTGGTTAYILPELAGRKIEYFFTDVSPLFLSKAKQRFSQYPNVHYQLFDIEKSLSSQGLTENSFDIIIAANVLHATQNLHQTTTHIKQLLSPGGLLVLLEGVYPVRWLDLIFGLTPGWWRFQDYSLRPDYPLISAAKWQQLLKDVGFESTALLNPPNLLDTDELKNHNYQQAVIVAQTPLLSSLDDSESWLILADNGGIGQKLAAALEIKGISCYLVFAGEDYRELSKNTYQVNPTRREDIQQCFNVIYSTNPSHLVNLWTLDIPPIEELTTQLIEAQQFLCSGVLHWLQIIIESNIPSLPQWWIVTKGAVNASNITSAPLWGMAKVMRLEYPEIQCRCLDVDFQADEELLDILLAELFANSQEVEIAWQNQTRRVPRLTRKSIQGISPYQLTISQRGSLENLQFQSVSRRPPKATEVEICVQATGLNFRDVLNALDLYPGEQRLLGCECVGEIVAVGAQVKLQVGERVIALASGSFSEYVTVDAAMVVPTQHLSVTDAATIPVAFTTAYYTLHHLAKIRSGDKVLIHAAAGGVGIAAIQIAQNAGAEVFATANPRKWEMLQKLGVKHIFNSRTLDFSDEILNATQGEGVDVILNCLSGDFIERSFAVLKPQGRFVEIGKIGVWQLEQVKQVKPFADYFLVDLVDLCHQQPQLIQDILLFLVEEFTNHRLQPLPSQVFPISGVVNAFRYMQQGKHTGKVVVESRRKEVLLGTYLITGGLGGLGILVARSLFQMGARHLVLLGRNAPNANVQAQIQELEASGATVTVAQVDVSQRQDLANVLTNIEQSGNKLAGVIHAAGLLDDGTLLQLDWQRFEKVMGAKVMGAWNLHCLTLHQPLDFFVLFSSATALFGSPGQANHVAANSFLDALAQYRSSQGLPGMSINWGVWEDVGSAVQATGKMQQQGINAIAPSLGIEVFEYLLTQPMTQVGVVPIDWQQFAKEFVSPFVEQFQISKTSSTAITPSSQILQQLSQAGPEGYKLLDNYVRTLIGEILGFHQDEINPKAGFFDLGMDSLTAIEFKNRLQTNLKCTLSATVAFDYPTVEKLVEYLGKLLQLNSSSSVVTPEIEVTSESLSQLSSDDIADLLAQELSEIEHG